MIEIVRGDITKIEVDATVSQRPARAEMDEMLDKMAAALKIPGSG